MAYAFLAAAILGGLLIIFGRQFLSLFTSEPEVIDAGMQRIMIMGLSYAVSSFMDCTIAGIKRTWQDYSSNNSGYYRFVCVQSSMGVYNICTFPHYTIIVPVISMFVDNYSCRRDNLFRAYI